MEQRWLDGIGRRTEFDPSARPRPVPQKQPRRPWLRVLIVVVFMGVTVGVMVPLRPLLAALPDAPVTDQLALLQFLRPGTYLVLFQNQRELRPTGGFLGSFAEVRVGWFGRLESITVESNIYLREAAYPSVHLPAPVPIRELTGQADLTLHDSNWALDFPEAAATIAWLYEQKGGQAVDGVIGLDTRVLERLLAATGPLTLPDEARVVTAETITDFLQQEVEETYWTDPAHRLENQPKAIVADVIPLLVRRTRELPWDVLREVLEQSVAEKDLLIAARDRDRATVFASANWDGHVAHRPGDYLYLNEANLSGADNFGKTYGAKSSWSLDRSLTVVRTASADGWLSHQLIYDRTHRGAMVWPDGPNRSFVRLAIPLGSRLEMVKRNGSDSLSEVRLSEEAGRMVIGLWLEVAPGASERLEVVYRTTQSEAEPLTLQRQPGMPAFPVEIWDNQTLRWRGDLVTDVMVE